MAAALPALLPVAGSLIGKLVGGKSKTQAAVPQDMAGTRQNQIGLMNYLLGFGGRPQGLMQPGQQAKPMTQWQMGGQQQGPQGAMQPNQPQGGLNFGGGTPNIGPGQQSGGQSGGLQQYQGGMQNAGFGQSMTGGQTPQQGPGGGLLDDRLQSYFGNLGVNQSGLQNQATTGISRYLNQQSPEQRALESAYPFLQGATGNQQGTLGGFYNQNLQNPQAGGAGGDVESSLQQFMQTGGFGGQGGQGGLSDQLQAAIGNLLAGGGASATQGQIAGSSALQKLANSNPGQGVVDALNPLFSRHLAEANQEGGRFGSANAIMRSRAVDDYNLLAQQALQQGVTQQIQAASQLGQGGGSANGAGAQMGAINAAMQLLSQQAGNKLGAANQLGGFRQQGFGNQLQNANQFGNLGLGALGLQGQLAGQQGQNEFQRLLGGFGAGTEISGQNDLETQRRLNLIQGLMGGAQGAAFNVPITQTPSGAQQGASMGGGLAQLLMQSGLFGGGQGGQSAGAQNGGGFDWSQWLNQQGNARG
jgi:hypothetical protein